ncbi:MAG: AraC family transcriptional regulator [Planctomycetota bacterium]
MVPASEGFFWEWDEAQEKVSEHTYLAPSLLQRVAEDAYGINPDRFQLRHAFDVHDDRLMSCLSLLHREFDVSANGAASNSSAHLSLYIGGISQALALHLVRDYGTQAPRDIFRTGALTHREVATVRDYIMAHLREDIRLDDLAEAVGLSTFYFSRRFKHATGQTPHRFVMDCRVERAREFLADPRYAERTIAWVAAECGFADQSHLCRHVRRLLDTTPSAIRQSD